jgi:hypothetical protein
LAPHIQASFIFLTMNRGMTTSPEIKMQYHALFFSRFEPLSRVCVSCCRTLSFFFLTTRSGIQIATTQRPSITACVCVFFLGTYTDRGIFNFSQKSTISSSQSRLFFLKQAPLSCLRWREVFTGVCGAGDRPPAGQVQPCTATHRAPCPSAKPEQTHWPASPAVEK